MTDKAIRSLVDEFVTQLESLIRKAALDSIAASLGASLGTTTSRPGRPAKRSAKGAAKKSSPKAGAPKKRAAAKSSGGGGRRTSEQIDGLAKKILGYVKSNPGKRAEQIKAALSIPANHWALPIAKLLTENQLSVKGHKRATEYFAKR
jgi:hypothetical protein